MLIDFHTHLFPEKIAARTVALLRENMERNGIVWLRPSYDGTARGLKEYMASTGVDISVVLPIATKPTQYKTINAYARQITDGTLISFASLHPYQDNADEVIDEIARNGFKGIKLHPDYQGVYADDESVIRVVRRAAERGLYTVFHAGEDAGVRPPFRSTVEHLKRMLAKTDQSLVILAHMGGFNQWDEVESELVNTDAYFDISMVSRFMDTERYRRIIDKHGADKILFGSDGPWEDVSMTLDFLGRAGLSEEETELITHKNAARILWPT